MSSWVGWLIAGIVMVVGGVLALVNPFAASFAAEQFAAWAFLIGGIFQFFAIFASHGWKARLWAVVVAIATLWVGFALLTHPFAGIVAFAYLIAFAFLVGGIAKIVMAIGSGMEEGRVLLFLSGAVSLILAIMILGNFVNTAGSILGILLGIDLISTGVMAIMLSLVRKKIKTTVEHALHS